MMGRIVKGRKPGEYKTERMIGIRMKPDFVDHLKLKAGVEGKTLQQYIVQCLEVCSGWETPAADRRRGRPRKG